MLSFQDNFKHCRDNSEWDPQTFQRSVDTVSISPSVHPHDSKFTENEVTFDWNDGSSTSFSAEFLRNWSYWDAKDINSGQTATTTSTPQHINSSNGHAVKEFGLHGNGYKNWWAIHSEKDYHQPSETVWDTETLRRESSSREKPVSSNGYVYWSGMLSSDPKLPSVSYEAFIESNKSLQDCLETIARWGFCCVDNVPHTMEATEKACRSVELRLASTRVGGLSRIKYYHFRFAGGFHFLVLLYTVRRVCGGQKCVRKGTTLPILHKR